MSITKIPDGELYNMLLYTYIDQNTNLIFNKFYGSLLPDYSYRENGVVKYHYDHGKFVVKFPLLFSQMATLYQIDKLKYQGRLNDALFNFLGYHFRNNVTFIINKEGFLLYILVAQITKSEIIMINTFFSEHIDDLDKFQHTSREYTREIVPFKPLSAKIKIGVKQEDVILTFF
jgi:hypothetical protein